MKKEQVELTYTVDHDDAQICNGHELAHELIKDAYRLLSFYAHGCPQCTLTLFAHYADTVVETIGNDTLPDGTLKDGMVLAFCPGTDDEKAKLIRKHLDELHTLTRAILEAAKRPHAHDNDHIH